MQLPPKKYIDAVDMSIANGRSVVKLNKIMHKTEIERIVCYYCLQNLWVRYDETKGELHIAKVRKKPSTS